MESVLILGTGLTGRSAARYLKDKSRFNFFDTRTKKELSQIFINNREFLENLNSDQFAKIQAFFETMPKLSHTIEVYNPKTKVKSDVVLEGLASFFE